MMRATTAIRQSSRLQLGFSQWKKQRVMSIRESRNRIGSTVTRSISTEQQQSQDVNSQWMLLAAGLALALSASAVVGHRGAAQCDVSTRKSKLNRTLSLRGHISLEEKYNIEWDIVLGEGAYGSVHPARLAATGEKVCGSRLYTQYQATCLYSLSRASFAPSLIPFSSH